MSEARDGDDPEQRELERALQLFDEGHYHQAHEVLDELWEQTHGADADFYKGLIQAAIAMHHFARSNPDGARKLYSGHRRYLAPYLPAHRGLDLAALLAEMQRVLGPLGRTAPGAPGPAFEPEARPRVRFLAKD
jgi:predicted metal-dependent hydrolase